MTAPASNVQTRDPRIWLARYVGLQTKIDRKLVGSLERASRDAEKRIRQLRGKRNVSAVAERAQLQSARVQIHRVIEELWRQVGDLTRVGQQQATAAAIQMSWEWDEFLLTRVFPGSAERDAMRDSLEQTASRNVEAAISRMTRGGVPLSERIYRSRLLTTGQIDSRIDSALARGLNWKQFSDQMRDSFKPDVPGGVAYAAKRLARTEINAAYHAITIEQNMGKPWNTGMAWRTSRSHPKPDLCDLYQDRSPYPADAVPSKPHPQCLCYTYPETVSPEEFVRNYRMGQYDGYIASEYGVLGRRVA